MTPVNRRRLAKIEAAETPRSASKRNALTEPPDDVSRLRRLSLRPEGDHLRRLSEQRLELLSSGRSSEELEREIDAEWRKLERLLTAL